MRSLLAPAHGLTASDPSGTGIFVIQSTLNGVTKEGHGFVEQ